MDASLLKANLLQMWRLQKYRELRERKIIQKANQTENLIIKDLRTKDRQVIEEIYRTGTGAGFVKKTFRKQIRRYLLEKGYLNEAEEEKKGTKKDVRKKVVTKKVKKVTVKKEGKKKEKREQQKEKEEMSIK